MQPYLAVVTPLQNNGLLVMPVNTAAHPEHPIVLPPANGGAHPEHPIAPGGNPHPEHPIPPTIWPTPPVGTPPDGEKPPTGELPQVLTWHTVWTEEYGWALVGVASTGVAPSASTAPKPQVTAPKK